MIRIEVRHMEDRRSPGKDGAGIGVTWPQAEEKLELPEAGGGRKGSPPKGALVLNFWPPDL